MTATKSARPLLLDLFCCQGGAATGYHRAGFDVLGVDIEPQPNYPFRFIQADALKVLDGWDLSRFAAIHASPPCQFKTQMSNRYRGKGGVTDQHPDLLTPALERLRKLSMPWVVENVTGAKHMMRPTLILHGGMFGLGVHRPRFFESNVLMLAPQANPTANPLGVYGKHHDGRRLFDRTDGTIQRAPRSLAEAQEAMGMPWADWRGCKEAIPPAYTEHIGGFLVEALTGWMREHPESA